MKLYRRNQTTKFFTLAKVGSLSLVATGKTNAEVIALNLSSLGSNNQNITGSNAGISYGRKTVNNVLGGTSGNWWVWNNTNYKGIGADSTSSSMKFFVNSAANASPKRFNDYSVIGSTSGTLSSNFNFSLFFNAGARSQNFASPNNYLGFYDSNVNKYGWLQATWDSSNNFTFVAGAYENTPGVSIRAGVVPVPEPGTLTLGSLALLAGGGAAVRRYRKQRQVPAGLPQVSPELNK